jgi:hypothetical protein
LGINIRRNMPTSGVSQTIVRICYLMIFAEPLWFL